MSSTTTPAPLSAPSAAAPSRVVAPDPVLSIGAVFCAPPRAMPYLVRIERPTLAALGAYDRARVNEGGWFVFWQGECAGWFRDFEVCRVNAWRPGCVAISHNPGDTRVYLAVGGDYQSGATRWQFIIPVEDGK